MGSETTTSRLARLATCAALLVPLCAAAQSTLLSEVHTIATADTAVPVEHTFTTTVAGTYKITLTDVGATLTTPAPLGSAKMAVIQGNQVVGALVQLATGTSTVVLTLSGATANTTYALHVVGSPAAGMQAGEIGLDIAKPDGSELASYLDSLALPAATVAAGETLVSDVFSVANTDNYTITLNDLQLPKALKTLVLAVVPTGGTIPIATLPVAGTNAMQTTVSLAPGSYQLVAIGKTDPVDPTAVGGLFSASVVGTSGTPPYPAKISTVGLVTLVQSAALAAGPYSLTLADLNFPNALASVGAALVRDDGIEVAGPLTASANQAFTVTSSGNNYLAFAVAAPQVSPGLGSYSVQVQSTTAGTAPAISVARIVGAPSTGTTTNPSAFSFDTTIPAAGSYVITLTDFSFPGALTAVNLAAVQGGALLGTPLTKTGNFTINPTQGPLTLLAYSQASAAGGVFGVDVSPSTGAAVFDAAQPVGVAFVSRPLGITSIGSYQVTAADIGFPASFSSFDVLVTHGTQAVGQIFGGGKFSFDATSGTYFVNFIALPSGTDKAGTYSLSVAPTPPAPTVMLTGDVTHVASGGTVALKWSSQNATTCAASGGWSGTQPVSGQATSAALTGATTFTLTCSGDGGSVSQSLSVTIDSPTSPSGGGHGGGSISLLTLLGLAGALTRRLVRGTGMSRSRKVAVVACRQPALAHARSLPMRKGLAAAIVFLLPLLASANEASTDVSKAEPAPLAQIRGTLKERYPEAKVDTIAASKVLPGWYELVVGEEIVYADATADRLIVGKVIDTRTRENLTQKSWADAHRIDFKALPFAHSIKTVRGRGEHVVAIFEDPLCPYCQKLEEQMQGMQDVTIYRFLLPLESIHPGATVKSREIWCAKDRAAAWSEWMLKRTEPGESKPGECNEDPTGLMLQTAAKLNLNSTPTLVFADGHRLIGAPAQELLERDLQRSVAN